MNSRKPSAPMAAIILANAVIAFTILGYSTHAGAQNAPGSDPIVLSGTIGFAGLPLANDSVSKPLDPSMELPSWLQAKIVRFEAKTYAALGGGDGTVYTERDVVSRQTGNALQKNCTTDVASNTLVRPVTGSVSPSGAPIGPNAAASGPAGRFGPGSAVNQIAVLRGDVVTICK